MTCTLVQHEVKYNRGHQKLLYEITCGPIILIFMCGGESRISPVSLVLNPFSLHKFSSLKSTSDKSNTFSPFRSQFAIVITGGNSNTEIAAFRSTGSKTLNAMTSSDTSNLCCLSCLNSFSKMSIWESIIVIEM